MVPYISGSQSVEKSPEFHKMYENIKKIFYSSLYGKNCSLYAHNSLL